MRISDWSSDVCSSDLLLAALSGIRAVPPSRPHLSLSTEANTVFGEAIFVEADALVDGLVRRQMLIFVLKAPVEPAGEVAQRLAHILIGVRGHVLHDRAAPLDRDRHAIFVIIAAAMRDARAQLIEIAALDRTERIGDALKLDILGRVAADRRRCAPGVAVITFEAGPVALVPEAGKPDAGL